MRYIGRTVLFMIFVGALFAQQGQKPPYYSLGGYGNVVYPGTGHAPVNPPGGVNGPNFFAGARAPVAQHPQHRRSSVVLYPVYYGGYGGYDPAYYGDGSGQGQAPANDPNAAPPSVVINQNFVPPQGNPQVRDYTPDAPPDQANGMRLYQNPSHPFSDPTQRSADDEQPTLYLIAMKDHSIVQALGYWMENGALHYVSVEHTLNQVSMDLVDRDLSQRLNDERNVQFKLPAR
jgi:hypothetical protein